MQKSYLHYRQDSVRSSSGIQALDGFYSSLYPGESLDCACTVPPDDPRWQQDEKLLQNWIAHDPRSPAPRIQYAAVLRNHGWAYRGESYSGDVKEENWQPFQSHIDAAQKYLLSIKPITAIDPEWYVEALLLARDHGWSAAQYQSLLDEATKKFPSFYRFYELAAENAQPKWHGSKQQIENIANYAVKKNKAARGQEMYARVYISIESDWDYRGQNLQKETLMNWSRMKQGMNTIMAHYPSAKNLNRYAYLACQMKDQPQTALLFKRIKSFDTENWPATGKDGYYSCKAIAENNYPEYLKTVQTYGSADPIAIEKYKLYEAAYQAYRKRISAGNYKYDAHDEDEFKRLQAEYEKSAGH